MNLSRAISFLVSVSVTTHATAATVSKLMPDKTAAVVDLATDEEGLEKGAKICFDDPDNSSKKMCGVIAKTNGKKAILKFGKKSFPKISKGMEGSASNTSKGTVASKGKKIPSAFRLLFTPHIMSHVSYALPTYQAPAIGTTSTGSLWQSGTATKSSFFVFGGEAQFPVGGLGLGAGLRYKVYADQTILTDQIQRQEQPYLESTVKASAIGLWMDVVYFMARLSDDFFLPFTAGLDLEMSSVKFTSTSKYDTGGASTDFASAESSLTAVALRLGAGADLILFKPVTFGAKLNLLVPATSLNKKESATVNDSNAQSPTKEQDVLDALAHKAGGVGIEIGISAGAVF